MDEQTAALLEATLKYSAEKLYQLESLLARDTKEKEIVIGLRSLFSVLIHLSEVDK